MIQFHHVLNLFVFKWKTRDNFKIPLAHVRRKGIQTIYKFQNMFLWQTYDTLNTHADNDNINNIRAYYK